MKIISGKFKSRNFYQPYGIRPTTNMTRKAVFDIIGHDLAGMRVLDLFAGSGAIGFEAASLGAQQVVLVEKDQKCAEVIRQNLELFGLSNDRENFHLMEEDAFLAIKRLAQDRRKFDIVFLDPPYGHGLAKKALKTLEAYDILQPNSHIIIEHSKREVLPEHTETFSLMTQRKYGLAYLTIFNKVTKTPDTMSPAGDVVTCKKDL